MDYIDLDSYHLAKATATRINPTKTANKELFPSHHAFRLAEESISITADEETAIYPPVYSLTQTMLLQFSVLNGDEYQRINGSLEGVYQAVFLASGLPVGEENGWKIPFAVDINEEKRAIVEIHLLGLYNPNNGENYENRMHLELTDDEQKSYTTEIDLSEVITDMLDDNEGNIPKDIPIEIELEVVEMRLSASVKPWKEGGNGSGTVDK